MSYLERIFNPMRYLIITLWLLLPILTLAQEEIEYKEYSYTELFQMIEDEENSVFRLRNALIKPNPRTDQYFLIDGINGLDMETPMVTHTPKDSIHIHKALYLDNVQFLIEGNNTSALPVLHHIAFHKSVTLINTTNLLIEDCSFKDQLNIRLNNRIHELVEDRALGLQHFSRIFTSNLEQGFYYVKNGINRTQKLDIFFALSNSIVNQGKGDITISNNRQAQFALYGNTFIGNRMTALLHEADYLFIENNTFDVDFVELFSPSTENITYNFSNNIFTGYTGLDINPNEISFIEWDQFNGASISTGIYQELKEIANRNSHIAKRDAMESQVVNLYQKPYLKIYFDSVRISNEKRYKAEQRIKGRFGKLYKAQNDMDFANMVYVESKDLETQRLAYLYQKDPHFNTFFKWKINQFLKLFSAYGTEPSRAIVFSVYVILAFALVYLFFPNYWDSHGKNRIMDRYRFFLKYVNKDSGMHEVYLDEKKPELLASEDFKLYLEEQGKTAPKFFLATALPLYRWSIAGTKSASWLLSKVDVLKGKWSDTEDSKKGGKSVLLIGAFLIALIYDVFIKMLNALMLSINTFTTLGFGEIPIKGLPRYLAIIQGFIGWFMLTIFSVSLISQLLN